MTITEESYRVEIRREVCGGCMYRRPSRYEPERCDYEVEGVCPIFANLSGVREAIRGIRSGSMAPYESALWNTVCVHCKYVHDGVCEIRDLHREMPVCCVLDAYFPLVVRAIERVDNHGGYD